MEPLLSAEELDALRQTDPLSAAAREVRVVDLVACDHRAFMLLPQLQATASRLARAVESLVARELRTPCHAEEQAVEIVPGAQLRDLWGRPRFVYGLAIDGQQGGAVIAIDALLGGAFVNRQFGGEVDGAPLLDRAPTGTERRTVGRLATVLAGKLAQALEPMTTVDVRVQQDEQELPGGSAVVLLSLAVRLGDHAGRLAIAIDTACGCFEQRPVLRSVKPPQQGLLRTALGRVGIDVRVVLGGRRLSMRDFLQLAVGDVVMLGTPVGGEIEVLLGGRRKFLGTPMMQHGNLSVQIQGRCETSAGDHTTASSR